MTVENHGSIFLFRLHTQTAREWVDRERARTHLVGGALACEANYAGDLADGMLSDGLNLE